MWKLLILLSCGLTVFAMEATPEIGFPPRLEKSPPNGEVLFRTATADDSSRPLTLECLANGTPAPEYSWMKNDEILEETLYNITGNGKLTIEKPQIKDEGRYQCFAKNKYGIARSNVTVVRSAVFEKFKDEITKTITAEEGLPFQLQCDFPNGYPSPKVFWVLRNADSIKNINNPRITIDPEGTLWFSNITKEDASEDNTYSCSASHMFLNEYKLGTHIVLKVKTNKKSGTIIEPTQQYLSKRNEVALKGKRTEIFCIYSGTPQPKTIWTKDGRPIQWNDHISLGNFGKSIVIKNTQIEDAATYKCEASSLGKKQTHSIILKVNVLPYFTVTPENINGAEGGSVELKCDASGIPEPELQWYFNGKLMKDTEPNENRLVALNKITLHNLNEKDIGNYGCNASSTLGYIYKEVMLTMHEITEY